MEQRGPVHWLQHCLNITRILSRYPQDHVSYIIFDLDLMVGTQADLRKIVGATVWFSNPSVVENNVLIRTEYLMGPISVISPPNFAPFSWISPKITHSPEPTKITFI